MPTVEYTRTKGKKLAYKIDFDATGFTIGRDKQILARSGVRIYPGGPDIPGAAEAAQLVGAKLMIEELSGMAHE